jgi:hypothetical protein
MSNVKSWEETITPILAHQKNAVLAETWGHLAPQKNTSYKGKILFCVSGYGYTGTAIVASEFENLEDSPWLYDAMQEYIDKWVKLEEGCIYRIDCTFRNYRFYGTPKKVYSL